MTINISSQKIFKILQFLLILGIFVLALMSRPWDNSSSTANTRTIKVSGEATIEEQPDEYTFNPYFEATGVDQDALKEELSSKATQTIEELKSLGVEEKNITLDVSSYDYWYYDDDVEGTLTAYITIKVPEGELVQDVQDYLLTLPIKGQITPRATFSNDKQKELDARAVEEATNDAKSKAESQATLLGVEIGKVVKVEQGSESIFAEPFISDGASLTLEAEASALLPVTPGQNEYSQTVTVIYEIK